MRACMYVHTQKHTETQIYESMYVCTHAETQRNTNLNGGTYHALEISAKAKICCSKN